MDDKQAIEALYKQMYRAMIAKDTATLVKKNGRWLFVEQRASTY